MTDDQDQGEDSTLAPFYCGAEDDCEYSNPDWDRLRDHIMLTHVPRRS